MRNDIGNIEHHKIHRFTWIMGGVMVLSFVAGIMVDIDHPVARILGIHNGRFLHPYFAVLGLGFVGVGIILVIACLCRYLQLGLLRRPRA